MLGLPFNRSIPGGYGGLFGTFFICGIEEGEFCSLTPEQIKRFKDEYKSAEVLLAAVGNDLVTLKVQARPKQTNENERHAQPER